MRILIVDDDAGVGQALTSLFTSAGHEVRWAQDGATALRLSRGEPPPDVLLLDLCLRDEPSLPLISRLRPVRTLVITASSTTEAQRREIAESGAESLLSKSIDPLRLLAKVLP